jgi:hypothetical protein
MRRRGSAEWGLDLPCRAMKTRGVVAFASDIVVRSEALGRDRADGSVTAVPWELICG